MQPNIFITVFFFAALTVSTSSALAEPHSKCDLTFSKELRAQSVRELIDELEKLPIDTENIDLCLNSKGGTMSAARELVEYFETQTGQWGPHGITTRVANDMSCESACALVFMAGFQCWKEICYPSRVLEPFSRLAFHSPYIPPEDSVETNPAISAVVYQSALTDLGYFVELNSNPAFFGSAVRMPSTLIGEILSHHGKEFYVVDKLLQLLTFDINFDGKWKNPEGEVSFSPGAALVAACDNFFWGNQIIKSMPELGYHYFQDENSGELPGPFVVGNLEGIPTIHHNKLFGSGNTAWAVCTIMVGTDGPNRDPFISISSSLSARNEQDMQEDNFWNIENEVEASFEEAWALVSPALTSENSVMFWSMDYKLSDMGLR